MSALFSPQKEPADPAPTQADAPSLPQGRLRRSLIKLCFAGLLAAAAVFQIVSIVQTVATGTQQVATASRSQDLLRGLEENGSGLAQLVVNRTPRQSLAALSIREQELQADLTELSGLLHDAPGVTGLAQLQLASETLVADARALLFDAGNGARSQQLQQSTTGFLTSLQALRAHQAQLAETGFGGLVSQTRLRLVLLLLFLAGTLFLLSTVLITGFREMNRRERVEEKLREAMEEADQANRAKSRFLATITHEIRTPLNAIIGFSELLGQEKLSPDQKQQVSQLNTAGRTLSRIVDDVLNLSQIEEGRLELRHEEFSPNELFREAIDLVSVHSQAKGLVLTSEVASDMPRLLQGDPLRLSQVLLNLLNNAIKFTPSGYVTLRVSTANLEDDAIRLRIEVQDSGIGISAADQDQLFERFSQLSPGRREQNNGGSGLGLSIAQGLVRAMGGEIQLHSKEGEGSIFWFYLNLPVVDATTELPAEVPELSVLNAAAERVMLVDDSPETGDLIRRIMQREGIRVEVAQNPTKALAQIIEFDPDVVLCDMQMPELSGVELTRQIRALPKPYNEVPVIAFSAACVQGEIEEMMLAGANAFLAKPFKVTDLVAAISGVLADAGERYAEDNQRQPGEYSFRELEEMVALMGKEWVLRFVGRLTQRLEKSFQPDQSRSERMSMAHRVVAEAGQLGEKDLANAANALEAALRDGGDTTRIEAQFRNEARAFLSRLPLFTSRIG